uniref:Uncharacterized protein n=1 Tax=viral metagenome TaxID=1070528 RepID=A0A6C0DVK3_9ZZZZ
MSWKFKFLYAPRLFKAAARFQFFLLALKLNKQY